MTNKAFEVMEESLKTMSKKAKKLIIVPNDGTLYKTKYIAKSTTVAMDYDFDINDTLALINDVKYIGIVSSEKLDTQGLTELINILTTKNQATVVSTSTSPLNCKIFFPLPEIGEKHNSGNYEYSYNQHYTSKWINNPNQNGWGVRVQNNLKCNYKSPLSTIRGYPVTSMAYLFCDSPATTINLIDWDTSNVTCMKYMFDCCKATTINGLNSFDTSNVTDMSFMFCDSHFITINLSNFNTAKTINMDSMFDNAKATCLDFNNFDTANVTSMKWMFSNGRVTSLVLNNFNTSNVVNMHGIFQNAKTTNFDLSRFDTSNVTDMGYMFCNSQATNLDLSSLDTSNVTNMYCMFWDSKVQSITARTQDDVDRYLKAIIIESIKITL